jgi:hypothetical protein
MPDSCDSGIALTIPTWPAMAWTGRFPIFFPNQKLAFTETMKLRGSP